MKHILFILLVFFSSLSATAQKQTYLLLAYGQKQINGICGEKIMFQQDEVSLMPAETITYRNKLLTEIRATYNKGYTNFFVELVPSGKAVIVYEYEKIFTPQRDGWDCTTTAYGIVRGNDMLAAEKAFAVLQAEYKKSTFKEVRRWGKPANLTPAAIGENDLDVKWKTLSKGYYLNMTNTRKDLALQVTIVSYKRAAGSKVQAGSETDLSKMTKSGESTITLEPGMKSQNTFPKTDGFEIRISPKGATKEEHGVIDKVKQLIKSYATCPDHNCDVRSLESQMGVRG